MSNFHLAEIGQFDADDLDTFDSYYANVVISRSCLIIPYVNVGVAKHPLNETNALHFVDFSYVVCQGLRYLKTQDRHFIGTRDDSDRLLYFGGAAFDNMYMPEFEVQAEIAYLRTIPGSRISHARWFLVGPMANVDLRDAAAFFAGARMPESIRQLASDT